jgi:hypothetical protein
MTVIQGIIRNKSNSTCLPTGGENILLPSFLPPFFLIAIRPAAAAAVPGRVEIGVGRFGFAAFPTAAST